MAILNSIVLKNFLQKLRRYEADVDAYQQSIVDPEYADPMNQMSQLSRQAELILPAREKRARNAGEESLLSDDEI